MAPAGGGRLVRLANLWRLPFQHLHAELEVPHLIRYPFRRAAADDDRFRVVREAHHDQRVPGAQRRARARVLDLRSGGQWVRPLPLAVGCGGAREECGEIFAAFGEIFGVLFSKRKQIPL